MWGISYVTKLILHYVILLPKKTASSDYAKYYHIFGYPDHAFSGQLSEDGVKKGISHTGRLWLSVVLLL